jgi:hypothetical protein
MATLASVAFAACDGDACFNGVLRDCVRLPSGDGVWVNHNPYTRCRVHVNKLPKLVRPLAPYTAAPPKHKTVEPPSPRITRAERAAHEKQCVSRKNQLAQQLRFWFQQCRGHLVPTSEWATAMAACENSKNAWEAQWDQVRRECPQYAGKKLRDDGKVVR